MGLTIVLQGEDGRPKADAVMDVTDVLHGILPTADDKSFRLIGYIDRYGETIFNRLQMHDFLEDWERLVPRAKSEADRSLLRTIAALAEECRRRVHLYLRFIGD